MKYESRENQGISARLLALMAVATGLSVANCYYNQLEFPTPTEAAVVETDSYTFIVEQLVFRYFALSA